PADVEMDDKKLSLREKGYKKFFLEHISAIEADRAVRTLFAQNTTGGSQSSREPQPVDVYADVRNNTLVVIASPTLIRRAQALIDELDQRPPEENRNRRVVRVFQIRNHNAADFRVILQDTLNGGEQQNISNIAEGNLQSNNQQLNQLDNANNSVTPVTPFSDVQFQRDNGTLSAPVNLFDVRITSDAASNQITVKAPEDAMEVIAEIIERLDRLPELVSEVKVFPIVNGDASEVIATLNQIFNGQQQGGGVGNQTSSLTDLPLQSPGSDGASLINIRFAVSQRTNTVIAVGSQSDLEFVESLVYRLDEENIQDRQTKIFRLSNLNVQDVAAAIQTFLDSQVTNNQSNPLTGAGQDATGVNLYRREVIVVEEATSNHLIVNARPEYMEQIEFLINNLDRRPPMVKIKAMIATVSLDQLENFGVEFGIQESDIFGAGLADTIGTGFVGLDNVGGQLLSNLGVGRASNNAGGVSGLVLSAGDESLNFVMRFLQQKGCANILFAPQIMTVENLTGSLFQGSEIQRLGGISQNAVTSQQDVEDVPVGIQLDVTPRVAPDGMIVMTVDVRNDSLGSVADGTVIGVDLNGNQIFSRPINRTIAQTAIMARSGQTVVISGLIQEEKSQTVTSVPFLGKLPVIGPLFQNIENTADRSELMVFITPYLVDDPEDISAMNEDDFSRMHWCKCDVAEAYGTTSYTGAPYSEQYPKVIYPQVDPLGSNPVFQEEADVNSEQELGLEPMDSVEEMMPPANDRWKNRGNGSGTRNADPFPERIEPQGSSSRSSRPEFNQAFGQQSRQRRLPNDFDYQQIERTNQPSYVDQRQGRVLPEYTARREMIDGRANFQSNQYRSDTFENFEDARSSDRRSGTRYRFSEGDESPSARNARHSYGGRETISVPMKKPRFILHN
ncbi:MAG: secretin N-terminal domain-containing protein, partial [Planctomycetota bacterium]